MVNISIGGMLCRISLLFPAVLTVMLYCDSTGTVMFGVAAAVIHEMGHLSALAIYRHYPQEIVFSCYGMKIIPAKDRTLSPLQMIVVLSAGIAVNVVCGLIAFVCHADLSFLFVHFGLAVLNALPVVPLDGGQILHIVLHCAFEEKWAHFIQNITELVCIVLIIVFGGVVLFTTRYNFTILMIAFYLILWKLFDKSN